MFFHCRNYLTAQSLSLQCPVSRSSLARTVSQADAVLVQLKRCVLFDLRYPRLEPSARQRGG